jgi:quinol-cytochrome oxidoreductase complex cytochrome b subunit
LWSVVARLAAQDRSAVAAQFIAAVNAVIDAGAERTAAVANRLPIQMFGLLGLLALVAMAITGYGCGIAGDRAFAATTIVSVLIAAVIILICDIHEPREGLINESQQSLIDLRASME